MRFVIFLKMMNKSVFVVIPAYNEGRAIRPVVQSLLALTYSVVVIDDGSGDDTWEILNSLPVYAVRHPVNLGQGAALQTGMTFALRQGARIIVHFDADGQHNAEDIETLLEPIRTGDADVVLGSRFLRGSDIQAVPRARRLLLKGAIIATWLATGVRLSDAHNGFRALTKEAAEKIRLRDNRFAHATEIIAQIRRLKLRYTERPVTIVYSDYSKAKGQPGWNSFNILVEIALRRIFR